MYRLKLSEPLALIGPDRVRELLQEAFAHPAGGHVRVACGSWSADDELELAELLRGNASEGKPEVLLLHCHPPVPDRTGLDHVKSPLMRSVPAEGFQVRYSAARLPYMILIDDHTAVMRTSRQPGEIEDVLIRNRDVVFLLSRVHDVWWRSAADVHPPGIGRVTLDSTQMHVLAYLRDGVKDEAAARAMNISLRTYRRQVAGILRSVDANSRFQAGLKAAQLGLTGPCDEMTGQRDDTAE
ncbi:hypothetical protein [Spongiactinospora sp. TRM90649]|uniref:hypothetical protein n=1 Tax=Spongiactinospora sp. TRM90649 TaxID=3031114 RepID=UPI0023F7D015|nr:hypothetical protein [Spongiactinospora sp. TRM90649]MDF5753140.1 hypothetical protein [Spongiactinospora sp. TRM90649]